MQSDNLVGVIENPINANPTCVMEAKAEGPIICSKVKLHST